ncbi:MAG TPA: hypothetical protein VF746_01650 [Longimicrobium sp.]|jgi:hypothetical protein
MTQHADAPAAIPVPAIAPAPGDVTAEPPRTRHAPPGDAAAEPGTLGQTRHEPAVRPWELELLIAGAVVFAMLQLPGRLDGWFHGLEPRLSISAHQALFLFYTYGKVIAYTLIGAFLLQLTVRAYWVGLIGVEAVFPHGAKWDADRYGPVTREVMRERTSSLQSLIDRADRFASLTFGFTFTLVMILVVGIGLTGLLWVLAFGVSRAAFGGAHHLPVFMALLLAIFVPSLVLWALDRTVAKRLAPGSRPWRVLRAGIVATYWLNLTWLYGTVMSTLFSNLPKRRANTIFLGVSFGMMALVLVKGTLGDVMGLDGAAYLPDDAGRRGASNAYYQSQREEGELYRNSPSIQSDIIREPYVRLFIPYNTLLLDRVIERRCPWVRPFEKGGNEGAADDAAMDAVLRCWSSLQRVTLNGRPLQPSYRFSRDPATGVRGIVAYLPTAGLPRGENVLTVERPPLPDDMGPLVKPRPRPPHYIPFWL